MYFSLFSPFVILSTILFALAAGLGISFVIRVWDIFTTRYLGSFSTTCAMLYINSRYFTLYLRFWGLGLLLIFLVTGVTLSMWPITAALLFLFYVIPRVLLQYFVKRQKTLLRDQLVTAMNVISNSVKAGLSLEEAIRIASGEIPEPLSHEFKRITSEYQHGRSFLDTLDDAKKRMDLPSFTLFVSALTANHKRGGKITDVLERLRKSLIENQRLERKLEAETASGNLVILILSIFPYGFLALSFVINYEPTLLLFTTLIGQVLFSLVLILTYIGYRWGSKIMSIEF